MKLEALHAHLLVAITFGLSTGTNAIGQHFAYDNFSDTSGLALNGAAHVRNTADGSVIRLVGGTTPQAGSVFFETEVDISGFSAAFEFRISNAGGQADWRGEPGGDGLVFALQGQSPIAVGGAGHDLGFGSISPSVGVEFDTYDNGGWLSDIDSNHIAILEDGNVDHSTTPWNFPISVPERFDNGQKLYVWADYDGQTLEVRMSPNGIRPVDPNVATSIFFTSLMDPGGPQTAYVGFTAGQWNAWGDCDLIRWEFGPTDSILLLNPISPGIAGRHNSVTVDNATPFEQVYFAVGFSPGSFPLVQCPGLALDIHTPHLAAVSQANIGGVVHVTANLSPAVKGKTLYLQAVEVATCRLSNTIKQLIF